jgi:hypothetical protein
LNSFFSVNTIEGDHVFCETKKYPLNIDIRPNPSAEAFLISCNTLNRIDLQIYDHLGRLVLRKWITDGDTVTCKQLSAGQYIIIVRDNINNSMATCKFVKL